MHVQTALLEAVEGTEWPQKLFHNQYQRKNGAGPVYQTCDLITRQTHIWLQYLAWHFINVNPNQKVSTIAIWSGSTMFTSLVIFVKNTSTRSIQNMTQLQHCFCWFKRISVKNIRTFFWEKVLLATCIWLVYVWQLPSVTWTKQKICNLAMLHLNFETQGCLVLALEEKFEQMF